MTAVEAEELAASRHEFRYYQHEIAGSIPVVRFVCWAGCPSATYLTEESARNAHTRHQNRYRGQR